MFALHNLIVYFKSLSRKVAMATDWLKLLKAVPWVEVARKAPEVADSAKKLWNTIAIKHPKSELEVRTEQEAFSSRDQVKVRLTAIETAQADLHYQMLTSSELIKTLADHNTQLIKRIELNHKRIQQLTAFIIFIGLLAVYCFIVIIAHQTIFR